MESFSFEKAREEATRMSEKVEAGQAKDYAEAEKQVELEKVSEMTPIVPTPETTNEVDIAARQEANAKKIAELREKLGIQPETAEFNPQRIEAGTNSEIDAIGESRDYFRNFEDS